MRHVGDGADEVAVGRQGEVDGAAGRDDVVAVVRNIAYFVVIPAQYGAVGGRVRVPLVAAGLGTIEATCPPAARIA